MPARVRGCAVVVALCAALPAAAAGPSDAAPEPREGLAVPAAVAGGWEALGPRLDARWRATPACADLRVERLAPSRGKLQILTTDVGLVVHVEDGERAGFCTVPGRFTVFSGHAAPEARGPCVEGVCAELRDHPALARALTDELATSQAWPEPPPAPSAPAPEPSPEHPLQGVVLLLWCLAAVGVPLALWIRAGASLSAPLGVWLVALAAVVLRTGLAWRLGIRPDELLDWGKPDLWGDLAGGEALMNPPLYRVITAPLAWGVDGDPRWSRLAPVALGGAATWVAGRLGVALWGPRAGLVAAAAVAAHPLLALAGAFHRPYALLVLWTLLAVAATERALASERASDRLLAAALAGGLPLVHYFGVGPLAGVLLWVLCDPRRGPARRWLRPLVAAAALVAPLVPLMLAGGLAKGADPTGYAGASHAWALLQSAPATIAGFVMPPLEAPVYVAYGAGVAADSVLAVGLGVALLLAARGLDRRRLLPMILLGAAAPLTAGFVLTGIRDFQLVAAVAPFALLAGAAVAGRPWGRAAAAALLAVCALCLARDWPDREVSRHASAIDWVGEREASWPVRVWPYAVVHEIGYHAGGSRAAADGAEGDEGAEPVRPLLRCSPGAVREAAGSRGRAAVLIQGDACTEPLLEDGAVLCDPLPAPVGWSALDCRVGAGDPGHGAGE